MKVETFECTEIASEPIEACEEAIGIIHELGLTAQEGLIAKTAMPERIPFREMQADEFFIYKQLCPRRFELEKYDASPMPLRVLQIAKLAKESGFFEHLYVWDRSSARVQDPVLVGTRKDPVNTWRDVTYILARWGSELESLPTLMKEAVKNWKSTRHAALLKIQREVVSALEDIKSNDGTMIPTQLEVPSAYNVI